jgi:hypothetical protein
VLLKKGSFGQHCLLNPLGIGNAGCNALIFSFNEILAKKKTTTQEAMPNKKMLLAFRR